MFKEIFLGLLLAMASAAGAQAQSACSPFVAFPLTLNLGSAPTGAGGETPRCSNFKIMTAMNTLPALITANITAIAANATAISGNTAAINNNTTAINGNITATAGALSAIGAINGKLGAANGIATLGSDGILTAAQRPPQTPINDPPRISAARVAGVQADTSTDQADGIMAAINSAPAAGAVVYLPCGNVRVSKTVLSSRQNIILEGGGQYCTTILASADFTSGDVFKMTGNYSGVRDIGFKQEQTSAQATATTQAGQLPFRAAGYTVNMAGAYQFVRNVSFLHCFVCVNMGITAGYGVVENVDMTFLTPISKSAGSGGIRVDNPSYGPNNWISKVLIYGDSSISDGSSTSRPQYGIQIYNAGAVNLNIFDILGFYNNLLINPGTGKTSQAVLASNGYFDSAQSDNVLIAPNGTGFVFHTHFSNVWLTNTITNGTSGLKLITTGATGNGNRPIMDTRFDNGFIVSTAQSSQAGVLIADSGATDTTIRGTIIAGWDIGINVGANVAHVTIADNSIGRYSPFGAGTNNNGIALTAGSGDWLSVHDNRLFGNAVSGLLNQSPSGTHLSIHDNLQ